MKKYTICFCRFTCLQAYKNLLNELGDQAGQHEMIAENLSTSVVQELSSLTKQLKDDRRKVCFSFRLSQIELILMQGHLNSHLAIVRYKSFTSKFKNGFFTLFIYNHLQMLTNDSHFMKQNTDFQECISQAYSPAPPLPTPKFLTTNESFQMRHYVRIFLKGHANCQG